MIKTLYWFPIARRYCGGLLGLPVNPDRPTAKLPYDGAWLIMGAEMVHLMQLPNPDPAHLQFRPEHGGAGDGMDGGFFTQLYIFFFHLRPVPELNALSCVYTLLLFWSNCQLPAD